MQINNPSAIENSATQAKSNASLLAQSTLYSASVGGKSYPANINLSAGQYVATIPQLPGIHAQGNTLLAAEHNLNARISVLV
jgi:hypothetical protein